MNTYFVTEDDSDYSQVFIIRAETAEAAVQAHVSEQSYDAYELEQGPFTVYEPKVNVKTYGFDVTPLWLRSHETPSGIQAPVASRGRLFYFFDEGLIGITDERLPDRWSLVCRDAFNGKLLWKRPLDAWGWRQWNRQRWEGKNWTTLRAGRTDVPGENQRRIVADADRLYTTLAYRAPMSILDAATGDLITTIEATAGTREILVSDGIAVAYTRQVPEDIAQRRGTADDAATQLVAVDGRTAKVLWRKPSGPIRPLALAIDNGRIVYLTGRDMVALDLKDGRRLWKVRPKSHTPRALLTVDDVIVMQGGTHVAAYDAADGSLLWEKKVGRIVGGEGDDLFVVDGLVWRGMASVDDKGKQVGKSPNAPHLMKKEGNYPGPKKGNTKSAFSKGAIFVRHGAKSAPATRHDIKRI
ncbi:hypothetical protein LCGC14_2701470, partial [marine sediment metagenome]